MRMKSFFRVAGRVLVVLSFIVSCCAAVFLGFTSWKAPIHQFNLWKLENNFRKVQHPAHSKLLTKLTGFGNLFRGASNGCDYLVGELRVENGPQESITKWYQGISIKPFDDTEPVPIEIKFIDDEEFSEGHHWYGPWFSWYEKIRESFNWKEMHMTPYVIFAKQTDYPPYGDVRCFYEPAIH